MTLKFEQIQAIIKNNPNKIAIEKGREMCKKLMLHLEGIGMEEAIIQCDHFASKDMHDVQKKYAISNVDLFARILQQEDMVFNARGGSSYFKLSETDEQAMNIILSDVGYGMNLRKWVKTFALQAYRCDPMGIIFMELEQMEINDAGEMAEPKAYPTYKSINRIFDYETEGRRLEYVVFKLNIGEALDFGIKDEAFKNLKADQETNYYRVVDDTKDLIVELKDGVVRMTTNIDQRNPLPNIWKRTPGFIVSDLIKYKDPDIFLSPVYNIVELADTYLQDRSIRDLQKKFHGFAKAVEPLLTCDKCDGSKFLNGTPCPSCTPPGGEPTGYKLKTKISDVARFPLEILEKGNFDFAKIFGYVSPDIKGWEKQDASLEDLAELMEMTYWGTIRIKKPKAGSTNEAITATESISNDAPKEARLNSIADWAEMTEKMIADFIGAYWFRDKFKSASISYGRDWILKTPEQLMAAYQTMREKGAPDFSLDEALEKYYQSKYQNNPIQLQRYIKMMNVEPFPHMLMIDAKNLVVNFEDYLAKLYFGEWSDTIPDLDWLRLPPTELIIKLKDYVKAKEIKQPAEPTPGVGGAPVPDPLKKKIEPAPVK